ncbi:MAG: amino acid--tRNA ligase-related protein [Candidatus Uhrbacteria bacterium]
MPIGEKVLVAGRVVLVDKLGQISRLGVFDVVENIEVIVFEQIESNGGSVPVFLTRTEENIRAMNKLIHYGDIVLIEGTKRVAGGTEVLIGDRITLLSKAIGDIYDPNIDFRKRSNLYGHRHIQLSRDPEGIAHFKRCSTIFRVIRQFLYEQGFEELNLTLLQDSFEAGLADPFMTRDTQQRRDLYLRLTSELFLRKLMIAGFSRVFEIGKSFRNQGSTRDTLPQFTILELYQAYATRQGIEQLLRDMICTVLVELFGSAQFQWQGKTIDCSGVWPSLDFKKELFRCIDQEYDEHLPVEDLAVWLDELGIDRPSVLNKYTIANALYSQVVSNISGPAFLRNLPAAQSPLFKLNDDGSTVDETLLVINGVFVADIVNPERDPEILRARMSEQLKYRQAGQVSCVNEDILEAMKFGLPPCRGIGMGLERLMKLILDLEDIREAELFPVF